MTTKTQGSAPRAVSLIQQLMVDYHAAMVAIVDLGGSLGGESDVQWKDGTLENISEVISDYEANKETWVQSTRDAEADGLVEHQ